MGTRSPNERPEVAPPNANFLKRVETGSDDVVRKLLNIPDLPKEQRYVALTEEQETQLREIERHAIVGFRGDLTQLENALGMLRLGYQMGWRVLYLIHSKRTIRTYEDILGIRIRDVFPPEGPSSEVSVGLNLARRFTNFWRVVGGDIKIPKRQDAV